MTLLAWARRALTAWAARRRLRRNLRAYTRARNALNRKTP
jgi:hypothetical protein